MAGSVGTGVAGIVRVGRARPRIRRIGAIGVGVSVSTGVGVAVSVGAGVSVPNGVSVRDLVVRRRLVRQVDQRRRLRDRVAENVTNTPSGGVFSFALTTSVHLPASG